MLFASPLMAMKLDQKAMQEFLANKKTMVAVSGSKIKNPEKNALFKRYEQLSKLDEAAADQEYAHPIIQANAKSLYEQLSNDPTYQNALKTARIENTTTAWDAFRTGNGALIERYFDANGIKTIKTSCEDFFNGNAHLDVEQVEKVVAQSFVIYYIRQLQRQEAVVAPSAIQIK